MGTRVPASQAYHKELLTFYIAEDHARLKLNILNLFSFLPSRPFLPLYFPIFYFQVYLAVAGHVIPMAPKIPLDKQDHYYPIRNYQCVLPHPQDKTVPLVESKGRATATRRQSRPLVSSELRSEIWVPMGMWRP